MVKGTKNIGRDDAFYGGLVYSSLSNKERKHPRNTDFCSLCGAWRGSLGLEPTPELYIAHLVAIFREVRRVMKNTAICWINMGDTYISNPGNRAKVGGFQGRASRERIEAESTMSMNKHNKGLKPKDLCMIPARLALALQADGWWIRSDIIWAKPNPMPESCTDRPTRSHEHVFLLTKSTRYYYDAEAIKEKGNQIQGPRPFGGAGNGKQNKDRQDYPSHYNWIKNHQNIGDTGFRNRRDVWTIPTFSFPENHFATFPPALVEPCIMAGTSERGVCPSCGAPWVRIVEKKEIPHNGITKSAYAKGMNANCLALLRQAARKRGEEYHSESHTIGWRPSCSCSEAVVPVPSLVLDPFGGSGTVGLVAAHAGRDFVLIDLSPEYCEMARKRIEPLLAQGSLVL